jgi:hypothetical protein
MSRSPATIAALVVALATVAVPMRAFAQPVAQPLPTSLTEATATADGDGPIERFNSPVVATGAAVFATSYAAAVITAASTDAPGNSHLYLPLVGPWIDLGARASCDSAHAHCGGDSAASKTLLAVDGVFQAAGAVTMIEGMLHPIRSRKSIMIRPTTFAAWNGTAPALQVAGRF